jgi:hypothetical protein
VSNVLLILLGLLVLAGISFVISRRRLPPIERGIRNFSREMQALAPRHPSEGPPKRRPVVATDSESPEPPGKPLVDPSQDDRPETET